MLTNLSRQVVLAERPMVAHSFWKRARGMIGRTFGAFDAFILPGCNSVHTWFMGGALDLIFLNAENKVLRKEPGVKPWRMVLGPAMACTVIELPPGRLCGISLETDDTLSW